MNKQEKQEAKRVVAELMEAGYDWQEATKRAGIEAGRSTAYSWWKKYRKEGVSGLIDGRHGHVAKMTEAVLHLMEVACQQDASISSSRLQKMLQDQMQVSVSITHLNETRALQGWTNQSLEKQKKRQKPPQAFRREQEDCYW